jgi:hypothetical protein
MTYNNWKLLDKIDVVVREIPNYGGFTGFIVEHGDTKALESAKEWGEGRWGREKDKYKVHTFDNSGFAAKILSSAGGSSQGGRLSFWMCEVEKDNVKFTIGVNDAVLADLIKNSDIASGVVKQKVMFARKGGQPGLIHEGMQAYKDATADMAHKAAMKSAKKTSKWEIGGVYETITQADICLGEVWDTMEEYQEKNNSYYSYYDTKLRKRDKPVKAMVWFTIDLDNNTNLDFTRILSDKLSGSSWLSTGKPPARTKTKQLEVKDSDLELIDKILAKREEYTGYNGPKIKGRYVRELK